MLSLLPLKQDEEGGGKLVTNPDHPLVNVKMEEAQDKPDINPDDLSQEVEMEGALAIQPVANLNGLSFSIVDLLPVLPLDQMLHSL